MLMTVSPWEREQGPDMRQERKLRSDFFLGDAYLCTEAVACDQFLIYHSALSDPRVLSLAQALQAYIATVSVPLLCIA